LSPSVAAEAASRAIATAGRAPGAVAARHPDEADGGLAVSIRAELDHAGPSVLVSVGIGRAMSTTASSARSFGIAVGLSAAANRGAAPRVACDEHAVAEPEARFVRVVVETPEFRGDALGLGRRPGRIPVRHATASRRPPAAPRAEGGHR
jgi:cysteine synthase